MVVELFSGGVLLTWIGINPATDHLLDIKKGFLNEPFFFIRFLVYSGFWLFLATSLWRNSRNQDTTGDRMLTRKSRFMSAWGLPVFALSIAFFAFDFLMAMVGSIRSGLRRKNSPCRSSCTRAAPTIS